MSTVNLPGFQKLWGWRISIFLFLAGAGAGTYLLGFILGAVHSQPQITGTAMPLSVMLVVLGVIFLGWQLEQRSNAWLVFSRPKTSWMSRGAIGLAIFLVLAVIDIGLLGSGLNRLIISHLVVGGLASLTAVFILLYTGMLLKTLKPVAFWNSNLLPLLFLVSGLSTGVMGLALGVGISGLRSAAATASLRLLVGYLMALVIVEAVILIIYCWRMNRPASNSSVQAILRGTLAWYFWVGVVIVGLVLPLALAPAASAALMVFTGMAGLAGGLFLKYVIIAGGASDWLDVGGVPVPLPVAARMTVSHYMKGERL